MSKIISGVHASEDLLQYGSKACGLIFLQHQGFRVPEFFIIPFDTLKNLTGQKEELSRLLDAWRKNQKIPDQSFWAVRSSAAVEDGQVKSFAGQFKTHIQVKPNELISAISDVIQAYAEIDEKYHLEKGFSYGIVLQKMLNPAYSGVAFSHNPQDLSDATVQLNIVPGLGEYLVSGKGSAFMITAQKKTFTYLNAAENFDGEFFNGTKQLVAKKGAEIKAEIQAIVPELVKGTQTCFKQKKIPVDLEFCIADNQLYWLQIRPITTGKPAEKPLSVWDNTPCEANFPGLTLPLTVSLTRRTFSGAYRNMAIQLGMKKKVLDANQIWFESMSGSINGRLYYNITAWQNLVYQLPLGKKIVRLLPKIWGTEPVVFIPPGTRQSFFRRTWIFSKLVMTFFRFRSSKANYLKHYNEVMSEIRQTNLTHLSHQDAITLFLSIEKKLTANWLAPAVNGLYTALFFSRLRSAINGSRISREHPNFVNDILFSTGDVISVIIVREFQKLVAEINQNAALKELFQQLSSTELEKKTQQHFPEFYTLVNHYIEEYGDRSEAGELKMETTNYRENRTAFFEYLKSGIDQVSVRQAQPSGFDYNQILRSTYPWNVFKRAYLKFLIRNTIRRIRDRENFRFMRTKTFSVLRQISRAMDHDLLSKSIIETKGDTLYLELDELLHAAKKDTYKTLIAARKKEYETYANQTAAARYHQMTTGFVPITEPTGTGGKNFITGIGCCSGEMYAEVLIIESNQFTDQELKGKILIAGYFEPGWINLFASAAGIISERGNLLSHTSIICREMGIPSIVGAKGILKRVKTGDRIRMNGATGKIVLDD
ncbi:MAG: hypothetical protein HYZ14_05180 [Bacteroidetes bacterium]|nr:hypothetical protein [Bacteroidota bacterium]